MSDLTVARIDPREAKAKADTMKNLARDIESLLNKVSSKLAEVNDEDTGMYHGARKPSELKAELDDYKATFHKFYEQVETYANNIITIAETMIAE